MSSLTALPVVVPFLAGAFLVAAGYIAPRRLEDGVASLVAVAVVALCVVLVVDAWHRPFAHWVGGWRPVHGAAIGIGLSVDPIGAGMAAFASLLVLAALAYSVR